MNLFNRVKHIPRGIAIIAEWLGDGGEVVDNATAQSRADLCLGCEKNIQGFTLTKAVALMVKQFLAVKNAAGLRVIGEKRLGVCQVCSCQLRLQIHEPGDKVKREMTYGEVKNFTDFCWKLKL